MSSDHEQDLVTRWLRKLDTARTPVDAEPPAFLMALGERLQHEQSATQGTGQQARARRRRIRLAWAASLASLVIIAVFVISSALLTPAAEASTPTPLTFHSPASEHQVVSDAITRLSEPDGVPEPLRAVRTISWAISIEDGKLMGPAIPQVVDLRWNADLSGRSSVVKGRTEDPVDGHVGRVVPTTKVISEQDFAPGEFGVPGADSPPATESGVSDLLTMFGMPDSPTTGQLVESMVTVMDYWTLSDEQEALLLEMIDRTGDAQSLGSTVDRLGRKVAGLRVVSSTSGLTHTVLISTTTGRIVGVESQRTASGDGIPAGTVVEYRMWDPE